MHALAARVAAGDTAALARACRWVDERAPGYRDLLEDLFEHSGRARRIGITGAPGVGKSTLTDALVALLRARGERVGVIAVDPSSPFTGGALLGDRIRMQRHALDAEVFVRSLASRGAHGGLSRSTADTLRLLDAWGANTLLVETVGVGQAEFELLGVVETTLLVVMPGSGDDVQANKAGILEAADVVVLNKADRPGADAAEAELKLGLSLSQTSLTSSASHRASAQTSAVSDGWATPVVRSVASSGNGVEDVLSALEAHQGWLSGTALGRERHAERVRRSVLSFLRDATSEALFDSVGELLDDLVEQVSARQLDPYRASGQLLAAILGTKRG
ncbi:MAG: methylmalonyl Co-A mutase-associated GTPase MeaB [Polyangiaceae bacterium]